MYGLKLSELLKQMPDFCNVAEERARFLDGEPTPPLSTGHPPMQRVLNRELYTALIVDRPDRGAWLDLETYRIIRVNIHDGVPEPPISDEPLRYLRVPAIPTHEQIAFATRALEQ